MCSSDLLLLGSSNLACLTLLIRLRLQLGSPAVSFSLSCSLLGSSFTCRLFCGSTLCRLGSSTRLSLRLGFRLRFRLGSSFFLCLSCSFGCNTSLLGSLSSCRLGSSLTGFRLSYSAGILSCGSLSSPV